MSVDLENLNCQKKSVVTADDEKIMWESPRDWLQDGYYATKSETEEESV